MGNLYLSCSNLIASSSIHIVHVFASKTEDRLCLYNALHFIFRKLILTGCCLVTRTVRVISTDSSINGEIIHSSFPSLCLGDNHGTVLEIILMFTMHRTYR